MSATCPYDFIASLHTTGQFFQTVLPEQTQNGLQSRFTVKRFCKSFLFLPEENQNIMIFCPVVGHRFI